MRTTATLHVHPLAATPTRIFEVRRLALEFGCAFIASKPSLKAPKAFPPVDPNSGGQAA
jgi:hypothetical protein